MALEWVAFFVVWVVAAATWVRLSRAGNRPRLVTLVVVLALLGGATAAGAAAWASRTRRAAEAREALLREVPREGRPGGYVSSDACRACHPAEHASWHRTFHRTMTQYATPETVRAPFEGVPPLRVKEGRLELSRRGDEFWVDFVPRSLDTATAGDARRRRFRVGLLTGSHHMQIYWVGDGTGNDAGNRLEMFPYAYLFEDQRWVPAQETFLADPRLAWQFDVWNTQCLQCHVTAGQPRAQPDGRAMASRVGELGVGCESCHGPGEEHVKRMQAPWRRYAATLSGAPATIDGLAIVNPARLPPRASSEVCGQCHGIFAITDYAGFLKEGFSYRPNQPLEHEKPTLRPDLASSAAHLATVKASDPEFEASRYWSDGTVRVTGREWTAMQRSACHTRGGLTCLSCHSMHQSDPNDQLAAGREGNEACFGCHGEYRAKLEAHTHHRAGSSGSLCYNCHMTYTAYGLLKAVRSHEIDSPRAATSATTGRPNACNQCHLDRTLAWTAETLRSWYGHGVPELSAQDRELAASVVWGLKGDAGQRALMAWSMGWDAARATSGPAWMPAHLVLALTDSYAAVRYLAQRSLRKTPGLEDVAYDYVAPPDQIERSVQAIIERWAARRQPELDPARARRLLLRLDGALETARIAELLAARDQRSLELRE